MQDPQVPSHVGRRRMEEADGQLVVHWMDGQPAPQAILDLLTFQLPTCECKWSQMYRYVQTVRIRPQLQALMKV